MQPGMEFASIFRTHLFGADIIDADTVTIVIIIDELSLWGAYDHMYEQGMFGRYRWWG